MNLAPKTQEELIDRAQSLAGLTIGEVANKLNLEVPTNLTTNKGWIGQLLETVLGATAHSKAEPDFQNLSIELKSIPVSDEGKPLETTFVSTIALHEMLGLQWRDSVVYKKLAQVLWVPILSTPTLPIAERIICTPIMWRMNAYYESLLRADWEELIELIALGHIEKITAKNGRYLHVRPKAANASVVTSMIDAEGNRQKTLPRGFYLRTQFTAKLLSEHFRF